MQAQEKAEFGRIPLLWLRLHVQNVMETLASVTSAWVYMNSEIISNFPMWLEHLQILAYETQSDCFLHNLVFFFLFDNSLNA